MLSWSNQSITKATLIPTPSVFLPIRFFDRIFHTDSQYFKYSQKYWITIHYPLVDGPIRELSQNSDAQSKYVKDLGSRPSDILQFFIIDREKHPISSIVSGEYIASQQSPALVAYNDRYFELRDWKSLKSLSESNKVHGPAYAQLMSFCWCIITDIALFTPTIQGFRSIWTRLPMCLSCMTCPFLRSLPLLALLYSNIFAIVDRLSSDLLWDHTCALESPQKAKI